MVLAEPIRPLQKLLALARSQGDISDVWASDDLAKLGQDCVADYERDLADRKEWADIVERAQESAAQEKRGEKTYPWAGASNVHYPLLTVAALQFNARAYPAIVKGDEAISVKVVGSDRGRPVMGPQGPMMQPGPDGQPQPVWQIPPGAKASRASRVRDYLNTVLFYRMDDWEADTDALLMTLPIDGCAFRKSWFDPQRGQQRSSLVSALRIIVPQSAKSIETTPRLTEEMPGEFPYQIAQRMREGTYRVVDLAPEGEDDQAPRLLLEQHRLIDVDGDGLPEPYIVTLDHATARVLRVEANFSAADVAVDGDRAMSITAGRFYTKYDFFPHPQGKFYGIGLGHLLEQIGGVVNTAINQMMDAGAAQVAGGGFIASGLRLQGNGGTSSFRYRPGEYRTVNGVSGTQLREAIVDRPVPGPSAIMVNILDMMLSAARDISSVKDVITGDASNNGQVGTTLALIEQGLQVFTAIYKRIYRALRAEYALLYENIGKWGGERAAADYMDVLDDPAADFAADFNTDDMDIRPVSDPTSVTRMQKMARAQFLLGVTQGRTDVDQGEVLRRVFEAADIEDADKLFTPPAQPNPMQVAGAQAELEKTQSETKRNVASAGLHEANALRTALEAGIMAGATNVGLATLGGGLPGMAGGPGNGLALPADAVGV